MYNNKFIILYYVGCTCSGSCTCLQNPCTCQYGNCPFHSNGFVLPVHYESDGDYVEYDYPERYRRQSSHPFAGITEMVGDMTGQITGTVRNVAQSINNQRSAQRDGQVTQIPSLVGQITGQITDAIGNTRRVVNGQQSEQPSSLIGQAPIFASEQRPQTFTRATDSVGDITGHITGMVHHTTQQATQLMNRFAMNREKRSVNNIKERGSLNFLESVRQSRQVDNAMRAISQQFQQILPQGDSITSMLSRLGNGQSSDLRARAEEMFQDLREGRFPDITTQIREMGGRLAATRDQELPFQEESQRPALQTIIQQFMQRLNGPQQNSRKKRSVYAANEWYGRQIPVLQVNERPNETIENFKRMSESRVELHAPECFGHASDLPSKSNDHEEHKKCTKCGTHLTDESMCQSCGTHQSQYIEYINGEPVSYQPKTTEKRNSESTNPRYVFDRYGHRYLEHNGRLRLMAPESHHDEFVGSPPNYFGLRDILDQNRDVMHDLNRNGPRMIPRPSEYIQDTIRYIHELARRDTKRTDSENKKSGDTKKKLKSIYQILPVRYDGKNGEMVMKVYSAKDRDDQYRQNNHQTNVAEKSKPTVRKFRKNSKEYEILSFDNNYSKTT